MALSDTLFPVLEGYLQAREGAGMLTGFVTLVEGIDAQGRPIILVAAPSEQSTHRSMGQVRFLEEWFASDARLQIAAAYSDCNCETDEDE